jgi:predicted GTPase
LNTVTERRSAPLYRGIAFNFSFMLHTFVQPQTFLCFFNRPTGVAPHFQGYLDIQLRQSFSLSGSPLRLNFRK